MIKDKEQYLDIAKQTTVLTSRIGSKAYGTSHANSDDDIRRIFVAPPKILASPFLDFNKGEIKDLSEEDTVYWEIASFAQKAPSSPDMLTALYARSELRELSGNRRIAKLLVDNKDAFLSKDLIFCLLGHANRDLKAMTRADKVEALTQKPCGLDFMFLDREQKKPYKLSKGATGRIVNAGRISDNKTLALRYYEGPGEDLVNAKGDLVIKKEPPKQYDTAVDLYFNQAELKRYLRAYTDRISGPAKTSKRHQLFEKYGFDTKQAGSAVRLSRMAFELAATGKYNVFREDADEIRSIITDGAWSLEKVRSVCKQLYADAHERAPGSSLPDKPDWDRIAKLYNRIVELSYPEPKLQSTLARSM